jgi:alanyl-tRNA synthetase
MATAGKDSPRHNPPGSLIWNARLYMHQATERLYYTDARLREFSARVVETSPDGCTVYLDRTAFYPASGGQPADRGLLDGVAVTDVRDEDDRVAHVLAEPRAAESSHATARGEIDWARRFDHMQQHTGQHLLSAVIEALFGFPTVSVHFGPETSTVELAAPDFTVEQSRRTEERCFELVSAALPVRVSFEDSASADGLRKASERTGTLRIISIEGIDRSACGGTHLSSLAEVGFILIRRRERIRGNTRLEFVAGNRALARAQRDYAVAAELSRTAAVAVDDLPAAVSTLRQRLADADKDRERLRMELARRDGQALYQNTHPSPDGIRRAWLSVPAVSEETRASLQAFVEPGHAVAAAVATGAPTILVATSSDSGIHAGNTLKQALRGGAGKGGGSAALAQGASPDPQVAASLKRLLGFE